MRMHTTRDDTIKQRTKSMWNSVSRLEGLIKLVVNPGGGFNAGELSAFSRSSEFVLAMGGYDRKQKIIGDVILAKFKKKS